MGLVAAHDVARPVGGNWYGVAARALRLATVRVALVETHPKMRRYEIYACIIKDRWRSVHPSSAKAPPKDRNVERVNVAGRSAQCRNGQWMNDANALKFDQTKRNEIRKKKYCTTASRQGNGRKGCDVVTPLKRKQKRKRKLNDVALDC